MKISFSQILIIIWIVCGLVDIVGASRGKVEGATLYAFIITLLYGLVKLFF